MVGTHAVYISSSALPLRIPASICNLRERVLHILIQLRILLEVQLIPIGMAVCTRSVSDFSATSYSEGTVTGILESDRAFHSARQEASIRGAMRVVLVCTAS